MSLPQANGEAVKYQDYLYLTNKRNNYLSESKNIEDKNTFLKTLQDFADVSTVHGLYYILKKDQNLHW